ncbi:phospho-N-acetylmuramoyl-pentapeptide-transferase [Prevotella sp. CAG:485]|nr:phospho-N-acetylmuramoyl-pentapeptide-transferase [Prevotella sp. CAG:485]
MLYWLFKYLSANFDFPGLRLMDYVSFRAGISLAVALLIALVFGQRIIHRLQRMQIGEVVRELGLEGQMSKKGTPTMGGLIIILSILVPCVLFGNLNNIYMILMLVATVWMGCIGFLDDYRKLKFHNKEGLKGKYKITGQVGLGLIVGITMWLSPSIQMRQVVTLPDTTAEVSEIVTAEDVTVDDGNIVKLGPLEKTPQTTIPFVKNNNFNYEWLTSWISDPEVAKTLGWLVFVLVVVLVVTAVSNGANLTDGLDGLCAGTSAVIGVALAIMAYLGGHIVYSSYLDIMYIPGSEELVVYAAAFIGALVGFLWYNAFPASVFMGDTGSLTLGGILAVFAILIRKELLIPLLCLVFFLEDLSVILQVAYFKITKRRFGTGRRIFKMTPLHHHFQKPGNAGIDALIQAPLRPVPESKIVIRFWIVSILLAAMTFVTLKIR